MKHSDATGFSGPWDVLVLGGGNAGLCAAITAREAGASVLILECAPTDFRGGNSRHTRNLRYVHPNADGIMTGPYLEDEFWEDLRRVTTGNTDETLAQLTIRDSADCGEWIGSQIGIGALIIQATYNFDSALLYATVLCGSAFSVMFFLAIRAIELSVVRWETGVAP